MKHQARASKSPKSKKQLRQLDQNSSFKSKLRLSKGKLGEIFKKPQYDRQLIAPEKAMVQFPFKKIVIENLAKEQQQIPKGLILTSTPHHTLGLKAQFFSDRRPSSSISPIKQQTPLKDIENEGANSGSETTDETSEIDLTAKKPRKEKSIIKCLTPDVTQKRPQNSQHNGSYQTRSKSDKRDVSNRVAEQQHVVSEKKQTVQDFVVSVDSSLKDNEEKNSYKLRRSRRDQHDDSTINRKCRTKSEPATFGATKKKSKIPLRTISQDNGIDANNKNENKELNVTFIQPAKTTTSKSGQAQAASYDVNTPKNTSLRVEPGSSYSSKENIVLEEGFGSPVKDRDIFVNKTPRSIRKLNYMVEDKAEIPTKRKRHNTVSLAVQTENINRLSEASKSSKIPTQSDSPKAKLIDDRVLTSPFKLFRQDNQESQKNIGKDVQTSFATTDFGGSPERRELYQFKNVSRQAELDRKRDFEEHLRGLEEFAREADKVAASIPPDGYKAIKKRPRKKAPTKPKKACGVLDNIVRKLTNRAEKTCRTDALCKTPNNNHASASKRNPIFRKSNRKASEKKGRVPAVITLGDDSRDSYHSYQNDSERPNIFDSLEAGNVVDVVDFSNEAVPELSATEKPWRFDGSDDPMPFSDNLSRKFGRKAAEITYRDSFNISEERLPGKISLESQRGFNNLPTRSLALLKSYSRNTNNKSLAPHQNLDFSDTDEETASPPPTDNTNVFKKPATPKRVAKKVASRANSTKLRSPVRRPSINGVKNITGTGEVDARSSNQINHAEKRNPKVMPSMQNVYTKKLRTRKNLFGPESADPAPTEKITKKSDTIANSSRSEKQFPSAEREQSRTHSENSKTGDHDCSSNRELRSRKAGPKQDQDRSVNRNKQNKSDVSSRRNISKTVSDPETNNNTEDFPEASPVNRLEKGKPKDDGPLELRVEVVPLNSLGSEDLMLKTNVISKTPKKQTRGSQARLKKHSFFLSAIDASNIIDDIGGSRPQRERRPPARSHTDILRHKPHLQVVPINPLTGVTSLKPRKPRTKSSTKNSNSRAADARLHNASEHTGYVSSQGSVTLNSIANTELSGLGIISTRKKANRPLNNLETIMDEDGLQDNVPPSKSAPTSKSKRGNRKNEITREANFKKPTEEEPKRSEPIIHDENARLDPVADYMTITDEQPRVFESAALPMLDGISQFSDVSNIQHSPQIIEHTRPDGGNIVAEHANDVINLQDNQPFIRPEPPSSRRKGRATKGKIGRPKKKPAAAKTIKEKLNQSEEVRVNENNDIQKGMELRCPRIVVDPTSSREEHLDDADLNNQPALNEHQNNQPEHREHEGDQGNTSKFNPDHPEASTFNSRLCSFDAMSQSGSRHSINGSADRSGYVRCVVDGKPREFRFVSRLPTEANFRKIENVYVSGSAKDPIDGLFSFGYLKILANDVKRLTVGKYALTFCVIKGSAQVELEANQCPVNEGECFMVPMGLKYAIKNVSVHNDLLLSYTRIAGRNT